MPRHCQRRVPLPADVPIAVALAATRTASLKLTLAGSVGIVADILLIAGCALLALRDGEPAVKQLFWIGLALSTGLFIVVDGLAGQVIPTIAAMTEKDLTAFALARKSFDVAFVLGVATFGRRPLPLSRSPTGRSSSALPCLGSASWPSSASRCTLRA